MKKALYLIMSALVLLLAASCASTKGAAAGVQVGTGDEFTADSFLMTAGEDWGTAAMVADFAPGVTYDGVDSIEAQVKYGETTAVWNFSGFEPNQALETTFMLNADFFMSDSFFEVSYLPGTYTAKDGLWPREKIREAMEIKWIDSVGRFAGSEWPDATDGWETVTYAEGKADENGNFSVVMIFNHYTENPPIVLLNFTNPVVSPLSN